MTQKISIKARFTLKNLSKTIAELIEKGFSIDAVKSGKDLWLITGKKSTAN